MAFKKLSISLDAENVDLLRELSEVGNVTISGFLDDMVTASRPQILTTIEAFKLIKTDQAKAMRLMGVALEDALKLGDQTAEKLNKATKPKVVKKRA